MEEMSSNIMRRAFLSLVLLGTLVVAAVVGVRNVGNAPVDPRSTAPTELTIPERAGVQRIASLLQEAGLIRSRWGFLLRVLLSGAQSGLKAGTYQFAKSESGKVILQRLRAGDALSPDRAVTIPEGFTLREIAKRVGQSGVADAPAVLSTARVDRFRGEFAFLAAVPDGSLEGYLFPDTYRFFPGTSPEDVVRKLLKRFDEQFTAAIREVPGLQGRTVHEVVTMASIIEREVRSREDRRIVSGILWSRLDHGVALEADATVHFAIDDWQRPLTAKDLQVDSPYNTRKVAGLPPGPIGNPGLDSIRAALNPQSSDYFYYLSDKDGKTIFSRTLEEHTAAIREHLR